MVLPRTQAAAQAADQAAAQAAAQASAQAIAQAAAQAATQAGMQDLDPEEATALIEYSSARQTPVAQFAPGADELIANLAQHFIAQTQALAAEQAMLYSQQQGQCDAQNAALMAVQASAEANVLYLTEQQRVIAQQLGEALTASHREIQEKFQCLEVHENKKKGEIEHFVNEKLEQALQEVQRASHETQLALASQNGGSRTRFEDVNANIANKLEAIPARINQVVKGQLAVLRGEMRPGEDINHLVQRMVDVPSAGAAESIKRALESELRDARDEMQREIGSGVEGPMREYARQLVLELTAQSESQLETRVQRALINTQADVNFQCQRQADATSILQEKLQRHISQTRSETLPVDEAAIKAVIPDVLRSDADQRSKLEQETQCSENPTNSRPDRVDFAAQINSTIEQSIQAAANTIGNAIKIGIHDLNPITDSYRERQQLFDDAEDKDDEDEEKMSTEELRLQQRNQDAWRRTYLDVRRGSTVLNAAGNVLLSEDAHDKDSEEKAVSRTRTCCHEEGAIALQRTQLPVELPATYRRSQTFDLAVGGVTSPANVVLVLQPPIIQELERPPPVHQEQSWHLNGLANLPPPPLSRIQPHEQRRLGYRPPTRSQDLRDLVVSLQQQVAQRAEVAARRHLLKRKGCRNWQ
ncbi:unnamed protein product [Phytophthora fragariaefolia]|uniref:Unnamed protein product n=1 Tax=Phytophthora fragariaefolia TaxID=1490495 RepID=A0A9W6Y2B8_9STRA|nr:unnamed protein product [Phytophthora fragariaefolia]